MCLGSHLVIGYYDGPVIKKSWLFIERPRRTRNVRPVLRRQGPTEECIMESMLDLMQTMGVDNMHSYA